MTAQQIRIVIVDDHPLFRNGLRLNTYGAKWDIECAEYADSPLDYRTGIDKAARMRIALKARSAARDPCSVGAAAEVSGMVVVVIGGSVSAAPQRFVTDV